MPRKIFPLTPVPKPRMVRSDKWKKRPIVQKYWAFCKELRALAGSFEVPESDYHLTFFLPMPKSWSKKKKRKMEGAPHQKRPDKDNLEKAFLDALCKDDAHIWDGRVSKRWTRPGKACIVIDYEENKDE